MNPTEHEDAVVETHEEWSLRKRRESMKVTRYQAKAALLNAGLLSGIESAIAASEDPLIKLAWAEASFERTSLFADQMMELTGLTGDQLDNLFDVAANIQ
jgi:hypothetical protein